MKRTHLRLAQITLTAVLILVTTVASAQNAGFKPIFDGKTLEGWKVPNTGHWSVKDGAITGQTTKENPAKGNQFIIWQLGEVDNFELKLKYRIDGTPGANSGIQFRSKVAKAGHVIGYQADIDKGGKWTGALYDEKGRGILAKRGQRVVIDNEGKKTPKTIADADALWAEMSKNEWNEYHVIAKGKKIILKINGKRMSVVIDNQEKDRDFSGVLALQLHAGPPMMVQFKDIQLKRVKMRKTKKVVIVAGKRSHGYGAHEHNAGCLLLAKVINENMPNVLAAVYQNGWPTDPTAFDNADAIAIYCDGGKRNVVIPHLQEVDKLMKKGIGMACLHYGVEVAKGEAGNYLLDWTGGYFEAHWSVNPHWRAEFKQIPNHPINRGVKPFSIDDEWYYHMRFPENMKNVTPILTAVPPASTLKRKDGSHSGNPDVRAKAGQPQHLAWAIERPDGGRGFGFTGGHWQQNWAHNDFRQVVLNGLVWITGAEVPAAGVPSKTPTIEELEANADYEKSDRWKPEEIKEQIKQWNK